LKNARNYHDELEMRVDEEYYFTIKTAGFPKNEDLR
jgi:hypothetical protein